MDWLDWLDFAVLNVTAAAGIAIDACLLVVLRFRSLLTLTDAMKWCLAVGSTHVIFPIGGFLLAWGSMTVFPWLTGYVYLVGASLLALLIVGVLLENTTESTEHRSAQTFGLAVLAVSWDALMSGPGKVVLLARYPPALAWLSFVLVGLLVATFVFLAGLLALCIRRWWWARLLPSASVLARYVTVAVLTEVAVFAFFMVWSLADAFEAFHEPVRFSLRGALWIATMIPVGLLMPRIERAQRQRVAPSLEREIEVSVETDGMPDRPVP